MPRRWSSTRSASRSVSSSSGAGTAARGFGIDVHSEPCRVEVDDKCASAHAHSIRRRCFQRASDVACGLCGALAKAERAREERARAERERMQRAVVEKELAAIRLRRGDVRKTELVPHGATHVEYRMIRDRAEKYVQAAHGSTLVVTKIEKLVNNELEEKFLTAKMDLMSGAAESNTHQLWHGSGKEGVDGIPKTGFRIPEWSDTNMFGRGVYFATDSSKSANELYTKGSKCIILCKPSTQQWSPSLNRQHSTLNPTP